MIDNLELATAPASEPIVLQDAKDHMRVTFNDDDAYIYSLITAAREWCENKQNRAYVTQTWNLWLDEFPIEDEIVIPKPPLQSVSSVKYFDPDDVETTVATTVYRVDENDYRPRIVLKDGQSWPSPTLRTAKGVQVQFVAGYGTASDVPQRVKQAILILVSHWYEAREPIIAGTIVAKVPWSAEALLSQEEVVAF